MPLKERFLNAETAFLSALIAGKSAIVQFDAEWETLCADFELAMDQSTLDSIDTETAYAVSSRIAIIADSLSELEETSQRITADLLAELDHALSSVTLEDVSPALPTKHRAIYHAEPFSWLLENAHDPYPATSLKKTWARQAKVTPRVMDDWFKSIRKEIGWVSLTKLHFRGQRSAAVASATAFLLNSGTETDMPFEVQTELLAIRERLNNLFLEERSLAPMPVRMSTNVSLAPSPLPLPSQRANELVDVSTTAPLIPPPRAHSRSPSLVFDSSDSEDDEKLPELSLGPSVGVTSGTVGFQKDNRYQEQRFEQLRCVISIF
jgi:hypothetical protein